MEFSMGICVGTCIGICIGICVGIRVEYGEDSREEAPQATTEHRVAKIQLSQQRNLGAM